MSITNLNQHFTIKSVTTPPQTGDFWIIGTTKTSRKIGEQNLPADYVLTEIQINCTSIINATGSNPAIIRVYQYGRETSAVTIEVSDVGLTIQPINLVISANYGTDRKVIIDAWDPDTVSPNNTCGISGTVTVTGRPYYSIIGATTLSSQI